MRDDNDFVKEAFMNYNQNSREDFYLPTYYRRFWENLEGINERTIFKAEVSSVILTTNSFGDFSKCTIVSECVAHEKMREVSEEARKLWQKFIHQPQTARCLVFFLLLGVICQAIALDYEAAINTLSSFIEFRVSPILCPWINAVI